MSGLGDELCMRTSCRHSISRKVTLQVDTFITPLSIQPRYYTTLRPISQAPYKARQENRSSSEKTHRCHARQDRPYLLSQFNQTNKKNVALVAQINAIIPVIFRECSKVLKFEINLPLLKLMSNQQVSAPIGIDLGSWTSKIAVAKRGGVEIITNEANFRETPCVVGYGPAERNIGEAGNIKMKSNFKDTVSFPIRFLGLRPDYPMLRSEKKFCPAKCVTKDDRVAFEVKYQGQSETVYPEQVFAAYLNKLKFILQKNNFENKSGVLAVPAYLTQQERKALLDAAKIAEFSVTRLINESTAVALDYGMFRKNDLDATNPRNVLFIDFGHSKLSTFACSFTNSEMNVLDQEYCRHIGCRDIDYHLFEFYRSVFEKSSGGSDISENKKAIVKLFEQIERQRKILSGNIEHDLNIEYLMDECDLQYTMTREKLEELCQPIFKSIVEVLSKIRDSLKAKNIQLHSIELIGGGSRIPSFVHLVKNVFGIDPSRTLNSSESVARGCALMAAIKSPLFRVSDYALNERVYYGVKFSWNFVEGQKFLGLNSELYPEKQRKFIYEAGAKVPSSKTIKFTRKEAIEILIEYEPAINGFNKHIGYFVTKPQHTQHETFGVAFKIKYTEDGLITFEECSLVEEWFQETKTPKKKDEKKKEEKKEGEPEKMEEEEFDIKKTKKEKYTAIKYDANNFDNFTQKDIDTFFAAESTMVNQDRMILQTYERKNELESLTYSWKEKLATSHQPYAKPEEIPAIIAFLDNQREWLYNDGQNANRGTYNEHIAAVKTKVNHIAKRYDSKELLDHQLKIMADAFNANYASLNSLDKKHEHITPEERQEGFTLIEKLKNSVSDALEQQKKKATWEDLIITPQQVKDQIRELNDKVKKIMGRPAPPPPPKPEEKKEQPAANPAAPQDKKMEEELPKAQKMDVQ